MYLGAHRFHNFSETGRVNRVVDTDKDVVIFPEYDAERALDNLAIVILQEAVKFSRKLFSIGNVNCFRMKVVGLNNQ